ncbi:hypothetical protein A2U01_0080420, partial [Trifolium medium]|nr:hypothetical protein [Trifolium medium]
ASGAYRSYDKQHRGTIIVLVPGCVVLVRSSYYDGKHRGTMDG